MTFDYYRTFVTFFRKAKSVDLILFWVYDFWHTIAINNMLLLLLTHYCYYQYTSIPVYQYATAKKKYKERYQEERCNKERCKEERLRSVTMPSFVLVVAQTIGLVDQPQAKR